MKGRHGFEFGARVVMTKPFVCSGTGAEPTGTDARIQREIDEAYGTEPVMATVVDPGEALWHAQLLYVQFDRPVWNSAGVWAQPEIFELEKAPPTDDEVAEAIKSILGT